MALSQQSSISSTNNLCSPNLTIEPIKHRQHYSIDYQVQHRNEITSRPLPILQIKYQLKQSKKPSKLLYLRFKRRNYECYEKSRSTIYKIDSNKKYKFGPIYSINQFSINHSKRKQSCLVYSFNSVSLEKLKAMKISRHRNIEKLIISTAIARKQSTKNIIEQKYFCQSISRFSQLKILCLIFSCNSTEIGFGHSVIDYIKHIRKFPLLNSLKIQFLKLKIFQGIIQEISDSLLFLPHLRGLKLNIGDYFFEEENKCCYLGQILSNSPKLEHYLLGYQYKNPEQFKSIMKDIGRGINLKVLHLHIQSENHLSIFDLCYHLLNLAKLQKLYLVLFFSISSSDQKKLFQACSILQELRDLDISFNQTQENNYKCEDILHLRQLHKLQLNLNQTDNNFNLDTQGQKLFSQIVDLESLTLFQVSFTGGQFSKNGYDTMMQNCAKMQNISILGLEFSFEVELQDIYVLQAMKSIIQMKKLKDLALTFHGDLKLTGKSIQSLGENIPKIKNLQLLELCLSNYNYKTQEAHFKIIEFEKLVAQFNKCECLNYIYFRLIGCFMPKQTLEDIFDDLDMNYSLQIV